MHELREVSGRMSMVNRHGYCYVSLRCSLLVNFIENRM